MELRLERMFHPDGMNGVLKYNDLIICFTIELPWRDNRKGKSCIPEGRYRLQDRWSPHLGQHIQVMNVPDRSLILIHPANDAKKELRGCIAPVGALKGPGKGERSEVAFRLVRYLVYRAIREGDSVWLTITKSVVSTGA